MSVFFHPNSWRPCDRIAVGCKRSESRYLACMRQYKRLESFDSLICLFCLIALANKKIRNENKNARIG